MVGIPPIFTSDDKTKLTYLHNSLFKLDANSNRRIVVSLVIKFGVSLVFKSQSLGILYRDNGMEESLVIHQYSHLMVRPASGPISILAYSSLMQTQIGVLLSPCLWSSPWSSNLRFPWFSRVIHFLSRKWHGRMIQIPPIFTSDDNTKWFLLYMSLFKLDVNSNRCIVVSLVI